MSYRVEHVPPGPHSRVPGRILFQFRRDVLGYLTGLARVHGDVVSFQSLFRRFYVFNHPDAVRDVLVTNDASFMKGPALRNAKDVLGEGLLTSEGEFHKRQRRLAQPAFHAQRVNAYATAMVEFARRMADERWRAGDVVDVHEQMMALTLAVVAKTLFDADVERDVQTLGRAMDVSVNMFTRAMMPGGKLLNFLPLPSNFRFLAARNTLRKTVDGFVRQRRAQGVDRGDLLSMLLRANDAEGDGSGMSDGQLRDECITLFTAGHETTANALTFAWYLLARHPEAAAALHAEVDAVLPDGRVPTVDDVPRLPYARAVLAESMRLFPPAWAIGREAVGDCTVGGYRVPRGSVILISQWVTHRDPRWWPEPERFRPERWIEPAGDRPRYAYFPFGGGSRACIGESFAWLEATLLLATLVRRWRGELVDAGELELLPTITLRPKGGVRLKLIDRRNAGDSRRREEREGGREGDAGATTDKRG